MSRPVAKLMVLNLKLPKLGREMLETVRMKRKDISTLQYVIDKTKNSIAIEEIDSRICSMEHIIGHETLPLKEEKLLIREIKQLNHLRGQISSNIGNQDEVQKTLNERDVNEERLRTLKKELENLKLKVSKVETIAKGESRKYEDESQELKKLRTQFKVARGPLAMKWNRWSKEETTGGVSKWE